MPIRIDDANEADLPGILAIYNWAVRETTAVWNDREDDVTGRAAWMNDRLRQGFPVLVARDGDGIAGYGTFGSFRAFDGYAATVENSIYVRPDTHRRGVGRALLAELIDRARASGKHVIVAGIEAGNLPSIGLHAALGYMEVARMPEVGHKFGRWLDLVLMQRSL